MIYLTTTCRSGAILPKPMSYFPLASFPKILLHLMLLMVSKELQDLAWLFDAARRKKRCALKTVLHANLNPHQLVAVVQNCTEEFLFASSSQRRLQHSSPKRRCLCRSPTPSKSVHFVFIVISQSLNMSSIQIP